MDQKVGAGHHKGADVPAPALETRHKSVWYCVVPLALPTDLVNKRALLCELYMEQSLATCATLNINSYKPLPAPIAGNELAICKCRKIQEETLF
mmetsp:Transcript_10856/g.20461  ORF Transcript_10856/g.20461 Transcript_10856/m.20461 type:complete len:94 (-) Transcript_10856:731-1012(-)